MPGLKSKYHDYKFTDILGAHEHLMAQGFKHDHGIRHINKSGKKAYLMQADGGFKNGYIVRHIA